MKATRNVSALAALVLLWSGLGQAMAGVMTFNNTGTVQEYAIPATGTYDINVAGAQGGTSYSGAINQFVAPGGLGALVSGDLNLSAGTELAIVVGAQGVSSFGNGGDAFGGGGGGGSFVYVVSGGQLLAVAGGGGGGGFDISGGGPGQSGEAGQAGSGAGGGAGGTGGNGGGAGTNGFFDGGGGAGWLSNGGSSTGAGGDGPPTFAGGAGLRGMSGGFGGGGGAGGDGGGGGGGYSGGGGGYGNGDYGGGGGGSYLAAAFTNSSAGPGVQSGDGYVTISSIATPEPSSLVLLGLGIVGLAAILIGRWRRRGISTR